MCLGASQGLKNVGQAQNSFYTTATNQAQQEFGASSTAFNDLMSAFTPIAEAGPSQQGWSPAQLSATNSAAITNVGQQYKAANTAVKENLAAANGGNVALPGGAEIGPELGLSSAAASQTASELNANLVSDYQQGNQNWKTAMAGIEGATNVFGAANSATQEANSAGSAAGQTQNYISSQDQSWMQLADAALGAGATLGSAGIKACWIAEAMWGMDDGRTHLLRRWLNEVWAEYSPLGARIMSLYRRFGQRLAKRRCAVVVLWPLFHLALWRARRWQLRGRN